MHPSAKKVAEQFVTFLNRAVTPFHAVEECSRLLKAAGFNELKETEIWQLKPMNKYFVTRNKSTVIAFAVGGKYVPGNGLSIVAAHTDSPNLRVKPVSKITSGSCLQVGVMTYGGGIWRSWFDRDLTIAGRVIVKDESGKLCHRLVYVDRPIMCIPNLAMHLDREANSKFIFNPEEHLRPILATSVAEKLNEKDSDTKSDGQNSVTAVDPVNSSGLSADHHSPFLNLLAQELDVDVGQIIDFDLCVIDYQPARIGGMNEEFVFGGRLDNLVGTYTAITGLLESLQNTDAFANDPNIRVAACFDNEECGSRSAQGAMSSMTEWIFRRLTSPDTFQSGSNERTTFERSIAKSYMISADQAHAVHPNYASKHDTNHAPAFHKGVVVKINANQNYATTAITHAILKEIADRADVPLQKFVVRNDIPCGSTIGPVMSATLGLQTIDVGTTQLAMHSVREMACTSGIYHAQKLYSKFYDILPEVLDNMNL